MPKQDITFDMGLADSRDPASLRPGELQKAVGCEYRVGTHHLHKLRGRLSTGNSFGAAVQGIHKLQYDSANDQVVAVAGGNLYEANATKLMATLSNETAEITGLDADAVPSFAALNDLWVMVNGVDSNYIRESGDVPGGSNGAWRTLGMQPPSHQMVSSLVASSGTKQRPYASTSTWTNPANAYDTDDTTYAYGTVQTGTTSIQEVWTFDTNLTGTGRGLKIKHQGIASSKSVGTGPSLRYASDSDDFNFGDTETSQITARLKLEYTEDYNAANPTWTEITDLRAPYAETTTEIILSDSIDIRDTASGGSATEGVAVRATMTATSIVGDTYAYGRVFDIAVTDHAADSALTTTNAMYYFFTEKYIDSNGVSHESAASPIVKVAALDGTKFGVALTLPGSARNSFATHYVIYRSLDESGGGYPNLYKIAEVDVAETSYTDIYDTNFTDTAEQQNIYEVVTVLYGDGSSIQMPINLPPPLSKQVIPFHGSMVYVPTTSSRLHYSIPSTISPKGIEQVPELYFLEFATESNDTIMSVARANNGRALIIYFERYTMLVLALPQATDPGVFDQRITEYVSNRRGCAGVHASTEVTLTNGRTIAVAVDALGVWATDGVSMIHEWSNDLDWDTHMDGVTLSGVQLVDNPAKRRVEMLYVDADGNRKEFHFFYGRMKQDVTGNHHVPLITGPHPTKVRYKHFNTIAGKWVGWSGDSTSTGDLFIEDETYSDASGGYNSDNDIPFQVKTANFYPAGLGRAVLTQFGYPLFESGSATVSLKGTFTRDGALSPYEKTKQFKVGEDKKVYWHAYADKHALLLEHINGSALPGLVGYSVEITDAGIGRDS